MLTKEQLALRAKGITGTDIGCIAGLSPWGSPLSVYLSKLGQAPEFVETEDVDRGTFLEDGIAKWWAKKTGATELREPGTLQSKRHPLVIATPDRSARLAGVPLALEVKSPRHSHRWGEPGTDQAPAHVLAQAHWEMMVLDVERCDVAALLNGELAVYPVQRSEDFEGQLLEVAERFWRDHVLAGVPPEAGARDSELLKGLLPRDTRPQLKLADLPRETVELLETFRAVRTEFKAMEEKHDALQNRIKQLIGDAGGLEAPWGRVDYRAQKSGGVSVDMKAVLTELRGYLQLQSTESPLLRRVLSELDSIEQRNTKQRAPSRPFVVRIKEAA